MSRERYGHSRSGAELGVEQRKPSAAAHLQCGGDHELSAVPRAQESLAEECEIVSYESVTSD